MQYGWREESRDFFVTENQEMSRIKRRNFIKNTTLSGAGVVLLGSNFNGFAANNNLKFLGKSPDVTFMPRRMSSWWLTLEDLQWNQKMIRDKAKRRAEGMVAANIDTAVNFGFHARFDASNYFKQLHEYFAFVKEQLHQYEIKYIEHYSCNHVTRPRNKDEFDRVHKRQRHHTLLFHDPIAAKHAQYEGHFFQDICEVDIIDGSRGYATAYQFEAFCHNNPNFLDMHKKYLERLVREVDFDGYMIDDMCDYVGLRACGCKYCRDRFKKDYGYEIPPTTDKNFWGDMTKHMLYWGNYDNPVFRSWINMKDDVIADHIQLVKNTIGAKPLFTCCSSTGPIYLNSVSLNLERSAHILDFFMLENVGLASDTIDWLWKDAEALQQKDIAEKRGSPAIALSYTIYQDGAYLGWSLARFWGVANWISTLQHRLLDEDPPDALENEDVAAPSNNWEMKHSKLDHDQSKDFTEVRLVYNYYCRINGWKDDDGKEHWDKVTNWSKSMVQHNIGYRFVRYKELEDGNLLVKEKTPLVLDGSACVSDAQFNAIKRYLSRGGTVWMALPFGTHDDKGYKRNRPLSEELLRGRYKNLVIVDSFTTADPLQNLISKKQFAPAVKQTGGDAGWALRMRHYKDGFAIHFLNYKLDATYRQEVKDIAGRPVIDKILSNVKDNQLVFEIDSDKLKLPALKLLSPEWGDKQRSVGITAIGKKQILKIDLSNTILYAVAQQG